jgi:hypothetical protein
MAEHAVKPQHEDAFKRPVGGMSIENLLSQCFSHNLILLAL